MNTPTNKLLPEIALIDGDIFRYEIGSIETNHPFVDGLKIPASEDLIETTLDERIRGILEAVGCMEYAIYITGSKNFRNDVAKLEPYKGHRAGKEKPFHWATIDNRLRKHWNAIEVNGNEADDILGMTQRAYLEVGTSSVICSRDKDLRMIEGYHYSWACGQHQPEKPLYWISPDAGMRWFYKQLLIGDSTDNILGCGKKEDAVWKSGERAGQAYRRRKGVGEVAADKLLFSCTNEQELYSTVSSQYKAVFGDEWADRLLEMGRLLYIGQTPDKMWNLPTFGGV